jgi:hypothetical protein
MPHRNNVTVGATQFARPASGCGKFLIQMRETPIFVVYPGPVYGWAVTAKGSTQNHFFSDKKVAVSYARSWAEANRPARVRVETREGRIEAEWVYEPFAKQR